MEFQLENPTIDTVVDYCNDMLPNDSIEIFDFGCDGDLVVSVVMYMENGPYPEYCKYPYWQIETYCNGKVVDETDDIRWDDDLYAEIERIWNKQNLCSDRY